MKKEGIADKYIFLVCLTISIGLFIGGFLCPPMGVIDGSVLTATGILLGFATLAVAAQAIHNDKYAKITKGDMVVEVGDDDDDEQ